MAVVWFKTGPWTASHPWPVGRMSMVISIRTTPCPLGYGPVLFEIHPFGIPSSSLVCDWADGRGRAWHVLCPVRFVRNMPIRHLVSYWSVRSSFMEPNLTQVLYTIHPSIRPVLFEIRPMAGGTLGPPCHLHGPVWSGTCPSGTWPGLVPGPIDIPVLFETRPWMTSGARSSLKSAFPGDFNPDHTHRHAFVLHPWVWFRFQSARPA